MQGVPAGRSTRQSGSRGVAAVAVAGRKTCSARRHLQGAVDGSGWRHGGAERPEGPGGRAGRLLMALAHARFVPFPRAPRRAPTTWSRPGARTHPPPGWQGRTVISLSSPHAIFGSCHSPETLLRAPAVSCQPVRPIEPNPGARDGAHMHVNLRVQEDHFTRTHAPHRRFAGRSRAETVR